MRSIPNTAAAVSVSSGPAEAQARAAPRPMLAAGGRLGGSLVTGPDQRQQPAAGCRRVWSWSLRLKVIVRLTLKKGLHVRAQATDCAESADRVPMNTILYFTTYM